MTTETPVHDHNIDGCAECLPEPAASDSDTISLFDLLIVIAQTRHTILWTTASFAIVAIIVSLLLPVRYTAMVTLLPPQQNTSLSAQLTSQLGSLGSVAALAGGGAGNLLKNPNEMYVGLFKSRTVEDGMIEHFGLMQEYHKKYISDARKKFERYATVDGSGKDGLLHIAVEDHDPRRAAELANGYVDQFRDLSEHLAVSEAGQRRLFFEQQLKQANRNLADAEEALKATEQKTGVIQLDSQARALIESAVSLRAQITAREVQIQGMQTFATGENSQLIEAQQELDSLRAQLAKLEADNETSDSIIVPKGQMTDASLAYVRKLRDVKYYETIFDILARQFEIAKLDEAKQGAVIQVVDAAVPPDKRSSPKRILIVIVTTAIGLLVGLIRAFLQASFERTKNDSRARRKLDSFRRAFGLGSTAAAQR